MTAAKRPHPNSVANLKKWPKGVSGNPSGRPKADPELTAKIHQLAPSAVRRLEELMASENDRVALAAALAIIERALGKPAAADDGKPGSDLSDREKDGMIESLQMLYDSAAHDVRQLQENNAELVRRLGGERPLGDGVALIPPPEGGL
jgi:hypothetical protein